MKILITGGGCREHIDSVRFVSNVSTGKTAAFIADFFANSGHSVVFICAASSVLPCNKSVKNIKFLSCKDLAETLQKELSLSFFDCIIHAAAVSDYIPKTLICDGQRFKAGISCSKINSQDELTIVMEKVPKIADNIKQWAVKNGSYPKLFCFKLTDTAIELKKKAYVTSLFECSKCDFVVSNDLSGVNGEIHKFMLYSKSYDGIVDEVARGETLLELAKAVMNAIIDL